MNRKSPLAVRLLSAAAMSLASASAVTITQDESQASTNATGWNATTIWNPNGAPTSGNDYINPSGFTLRTPEAGDSTFAGDSLTIRGTLALKSANGQSRTNTVNNLILDGAVVSSFTSGSGQTQTLAGGITVLTTSTINSGASTENRNIVISATVGGSANINIGVQGGQTGSRVEFNNGANTFSGDFLLGGGILRFNNTGSIGAADIVVDGGVLDVNYDWNSPTVLLDVNGGTIQMEAFSWTVGSLSVGATDFDPGTYTIAQLNAVGTGTFTGTTGTITVIPEPAAAVLSALGFGCLLLRRRRV